MTTSKINREISKEIWQRLRLVIKNLFSRIISEQIEFVSRKFSENFGKHFVAPSFQSHLAVNTLSLSLPLFAG